MNCQCDMPVKTKRCHCRTCCLTFTGPWAFDHHIVRGQHAEPSKRGLVQNHRGDWGSPSDASAQRFLDQVRSDR